MVFNLLQPKINIFLCKTPIGINTASIKYCYTNGNDLISLNIKNDKAKSTLTDMYIELVISKPTTTSV